MTIKEAIKGMMNFYKAIEAVYTELSKDVSTAVGITDEVKEQFNDYLVEVGDAVSEASDAAEQLERMQDVGVDCEHCKYNDSGANACKECSFYPYWLVPIDQKKPLNYEPI